VLNHFLFETKVASHPELNDRAQLLLKTLIERYISDGQPVGSRALSRDSHLNLSPATIRNVIADLEEMGLVTSPHTSAGRVPTVSGYRLFIDFLLEVKPLNNQEVTQMRRDLDAHDPDSIVESASKLLSDITKMAGVVMLPKREVSSFRHIEFLPLSNNRVLVILVTNEQEVQNKIIHPSKQLSTSELQQAANYLNAMFEGKDLVAVRKAVLKDLKVAEERVHREMVDAVEMAHLTFDHEENREGFVLRGETNLMEFSDLSDVDRLRQLFDAFNQKRTIIHLLDQCLGAEGVQIFIGEESGYEPLGSCSVVTSPYTVDNDIVGVLGVIGPTRMKYEHVIPIVDITAKLLGAALNHQK